jgi:4-nitrophenyl phosphatase
MGIPANVEEVFGSSYSAAIYISRILPQTHPEVVKRKKVFVLGEKGIETELESEGIEHLGGTDPAYRRDVTPEDYKLLAQGDPSVLDPDVGVVLCGLDFHFNYLKMCYAYHYIKRGAVFLATNVDSTLPSAGALFPGAGSITAPLVSMLGGQQPMSFGKPSQAMMDAIEGKFKFDRSKACMVGDRANTDIKFGLEGKLGGTLGVLTGVSSKTDFLEGDTRPAYYVDELGDLLGGA